MKIFFAEMEEKQKLLEFEICVKERTDYGIFHKTFTNYVLNPGRITVFIEFITFISKQYPEDYRQAVNILKGKK